MKRLLILPVLALAACAGHAVPEAAPAYRAPVRHHEQTVEEFVADTDTSDLYGLCDAITDLLDTGMSMERATGYFLDAIDENVDSDGRFTPREIGVALVEWCVDHGYQ